MRLLLTAFGPFLNIAENPSATLLKASGYDHRVLEVSFDAVRDFLAELESEPWDALLMLGVHGRARKIRWECKGRNMIGPQADVSGTTRPGLIEDRAPKSLRSTLQAPRVLPEGMIRTYDAGSYLCNFSLFSALQAFPEKKVAFLHIPPFERMPLERQLVALKALLKGI